MKVSIYGHHLLGGYFRAIKNSNRNFWSMFSNSWFLMIKLDILKYSDLRQMCLPEFFKVWEAARRNGVFDN
jgi:hypothetical protein